MDYDAHTFFLHLLTILVAARLFAELAVLVRVPAVIGELAAGVVIGPTLLGWIEPDRVIVMLSEIGIILLLFEVGLETDVRRLVRAGPKALLIAISGLLWPFVGGFWVSLEGFGRPVLESLFIGGALTATSIGITLRVLADLGHHHSHEAQLVLGAAVIDDVLGVVLLAVLDQFASGGNISPADAGRLLTFIVLFFVLAPIAANLISHIINRLDRISQAPGLLPTAVVSLVLFFAWLARQLGAPELLGGFAAGLALSRGFFLPFGLAVAIQPHFAERIDQQMRPIVYLFVPIFFVVVGLSLNFRTIDWRSPFIWEFSLALIAIAVVGKLVSALFIRESWSIRRAVGLAMLPRGEVGLIFAEAGRTARIFDDDVYATLVIVIAFTTVTGPLLLRLHYQGFRAKGRFRK